MNYHENRRALYLDKQHVTKPVFNQTTCPPPLFTSLCFVSTEELSSSNLCHQMFPGIQCPNVHFWGFHSFHDSIIYRFIYIKKQSIQNKLNINLGLQQVAD